MSNEILLITPPFTQLNTPYPATAYLKGYLNTIGINAFQMDLGIEVILKLFSRTGLSKIFRILESDEIALSENAFRIFSLRKQYLDCIDPCIHYLQNQDPTLAHCIANRDFFPEASRFDQLDDLEWAFGSLGVQDKARHFATLFLEDISDLIKEAIDPQFGFSRYAESLAMSASSFDELHFKLNEKETLVTEFTIELLDRQLKAQNPSIVCLSVPFPGNVFAAFKCGQHIKKNYPEIKIVLGGGFANTELRSVRDERIFQYLDFISLDDGEAPLNALLEYFDGKRPLEELKRVLGMKDGKVHYFNKAKEKDVPQREVGTPDYSDLLLKQYLSVIEVANPMHRLWSDGRWNKLTLAHGCYWGKCSFCDISLDYIKRYEPLTAEMLCDRIEEIIEQTGESGFHFVDEAAPPALLRDLSIEILRRDLKLSWWTNIRFEKNFTEDLCKLMNAAGCIAISGGLEVASDRLLDKMKKGVTVAQVARVTHAFTTAGVMVHAYLMYGFPTQTEQETIDSLEMVRQLFENGAIQSGFWHRFAMTAHSPVGLQPHAFDVMKIGPKFDGFADNDLFHDDPLGADHGQYSEGLRKSLFNFMHGICLDYPLKEWFDFEIPETQIPANYIEQAIFGSDEKNYRENAFLVWIGNAPIIEQVSNNYLQFEFHTKRDAYQIELDAKFGTWLNLEFQDLWNGKMKSIGLNNFIESFEKQSFGSFAKFSKGEFWGSLKELGLLVI